MVRPRDADPAASYEGILAAALAELRDTRPRNAISMRRVAERAGVSLGAVQYYFENKETLLEACLDGYYRRLTATAHRLVQDLAAGDLAPGAASIRHVMRTLYRFVRAERALVELRLITNALRGELHPSRQPEFMQALIGAASAALLPHVRVSELDVRLAVQMMAYGAIRMALMSESERRSVAGLSGQAADDAVEDFVVRAACRIVCAE